MALYRITRSEIRTQVWEVEAESEEGASDAIACDDSLKPVEDYGCGYPDVHIEQIEERSHT